MTENTHKDASSKTAATDPTNPFYVHHSDQPGSMLVSIKLNGTNYQSWKTAMTHALIAKKKLGFVDGSLAVPSADDDPTNFELWNQCNSMILSWLSHSIEPEIVAGAVHAKSARQVWEDLHDQFGQKNAPAIFRVQKAIATITQGTSSIASYYIKIKALWDELELYRSSIVCNRSKEHQDEKEEDKVMQFLMGLNDS